MNIIKILIDKLKNLDDKTKKIMHIGFIFSSLMCMFSILILFTYNNFYNLPDLFYIGISLFKTSTMFASTCFMCALGFDTIKNEMI